MCYKDVVLLTNIVQTIAHKKQGELTLLGYYFGVAHGVVREGGTHISNGLTWTTSNVQLICRCQSESGITAFL